jgi:hypothetical protein
MEEVDYFSGGRRNPPGEGKEKDIFGNLSDSNIPRLEELIFSYTLILAKYLEKEINARDVLERQS